MIISTPEATAMDLMHYPSQSGGLNHIATVLSELQESINPEKLLLLAENQNSLPWKQRRLHQTQQIPLFCDQNQFFFQITKSD